MSSQLVMGCSKDFADLLCSMHCMCFFDMLSDCQLAQLGVWMICAELLCNVHACVLVTYCLIVS